MSFKDMSGTLCGMPDGNIRNAQVAKNSAANIGERPNKTPILIAGVGNTRAFLAWLRACCPGRLTAQLQRKNLMVSHEQLTVSEMLSAHCGPLTGGKV
jgi:hypothetical protein